MTHMRTYTLRLLVLAVAIACLVITTGCPPTAAGNGHAAASNRDSKQLTGKVKINGSSTVFPIQNYISEKFQAKNKKVEVSVNFAGTGGGMKMFASANEADWIDIADASRPIKDSEAANFRKNVESDFIEIPLAYDGLTVVINPANTFVDNLTSAELQTIFKASGASTWKDVRAEWPAEPIKLYAPGQASGTFDYFNEAIMDDKKVPFHTDGITFSEDDNVLVQGVAGDPYAIGFFGYAYYVHNTDKVNAVAIKDSGDDDHEPTLPSNETVGNGSYRPLSRPIFMYVSLKSYARPEVKSYVDFAMTEKIWNDAVDSAGYIPFPDNLRDAIRTRIAEQVKGSEYAGGKKGSVTELFFK